MPYITGTFLDGSDYKKLITKKTRILRMFREENMARKHFLTLDLSNLSSSENIEAILFGESPHLTQEHLNEIAKCTKLKELTLHTSSDLDFSVLNQTNIEELIITFDCEADPCQSIAELKTLKKLRVKFKTPGLEFANPIHQSLELIPASVEELWINGPVSDFNLSRLEHLKLKELTLEHLPTCELNFSVEMAQNLEGLYIMSCEHIGFLHSWPFKGSKNLKILNFSGSSWNAIDVEGFCEIESLKRVLFSDIFSLFVSDRKNLKITSPGWQPYKECFGEF